MEEYLLKQVHDEFAKRVEEENTRQNHRIADMERTVEKISDLTVSINKLATSINSMAKEQKKQGERLETLEAVPAKNWNTVKVAILTAIGTAIGTGTVAAVINSI